MLYAQAQTTDPNSLSGWNDQVFEKVQQEMKKALQNGNNAIKYNGYLFNIKELESFISNFSTS